MPEESRVTATSAIEARHLSKHFGNVAALDDVSFSVAKGEFVALMGSSGSGKTTLMNLLTCLDTPTAGELWLDGVNAAGFDEEARRQFRARHIGLVFQQFHLIPYLNALENVMLAQHYHSVTDEASARRALEEVGLAHRVDHLPSELSGGEQQRVCIARALINEPPLLFADEPTGNLDAENEARVLEILQGLHSEGRTIVMVTHNPALGAYAQRVVRLQHGRIMQ
ncbi:MAG: ABC transporter ATP-binding protein [Candidatus Dactylopiibacterium carminicum]|uniref:ABC transporter ATP-binding protein n=1 Tax=Candidatus Dactylopiibacterium carminicum TaxID=857335 RepID=A0A272EWU1_9RHOO|nr:ABC transporter ATP-binding protein [Candidatus Dactylopiibacterium carminicum]KAF7600027.1 ABC transporter ATP-binding protein [Candidatus Dactylopiibacterium carminicum]PAS94583.1 MAG: ABC transporter ATP-binding protein [Candidatus Dactylopiibacterium carminicum]PAS97623.1 MAG: ABC transporter ATP-binding protein [Candidatus Dactylopiibacterium carminicum]PAT00031.1 MAG: ABC transporter ATP-binding protein [Candidatus Dactylopiibacterium carminicum]